MVSGRVLVTGGDGQVGAALRALLPHGDFRSHDELDVTDAAAVTAAVEGAAVVVHAAAITNVDACEAEPEAAAAVNDGGTRLVADAARAAGARVLYLSTDYVFSGDAAPYGEDDTTGPLNVYGRTKLAGEGHLDIERDLVVRTSWVFGDGRNFVRTILAAPPPLRVVDDQVGRPTSAAALARALAALVGRPEVTGRLHVAGDGQPCSWADLAAAALAVAGRDVRVERVDSASYAAGAGRVIAPRPPDSTLQLTRARELGLPLEDWRDSVAAYVRGIA
ncbi:MAG TPA: sugar nucleotide-binding protein [Actinomycetota bacterium]|nr:sugar nucleotide-binding protein [Actinomycetota bacterium]